MESNTSSSDAATSALSAHSENAAIQLVGRTAAARAVGVSVSTFIRKFEPHLQPVVDGRGWKMFVLEQVQQISRTVVTRIRSASIVADDADGDADALDRETYGKVLELLDAGKDVIEIARSLSLYIDEVEGVFEKWAHYRRGVFLSKEHVDKLGSLVGSATYVRSDLATADKLVDVVKNLCFAASQNLIDHSCAFCRNHSAQTYRKATYCPYCAQERFGRKQRT